MVDTVHSHFNWEHSIFCLKHNHFLLFLENYYQGHSLLLTETIPTDIMKLILICAATW